MAAKDGCFAAFVSKYARVTLDNKVFKIIKIP